MAFWRVDNSVGTFLPVDPITRSLMAKAYELRCIKYDILKASPAALSSLDSHSPSGGHQTLQFDQSADGTSNRHFEPVASFQLIWWNQGFNSRKKLSIWRPVVPMGMVYFGDIAVKGCVFHTFVLFLFVIRISLYFFIFFFFTINRELMGSSAF